MKRPAAIIFDYGNVIEVPLDRAAFDARLAEMAQEYGFASGPALWKHLYTSDVWQRAKLGQISREAFWRESLAPFGLVTEEEIQVFKARLFEHRGLRPNMRALLGELHPVYRLAVLSNTSRRQFADYLSQRRGLDGMFEVVVSSAEAGLAKPDPEIYRLVLGRLGVEPAQALFVDDLERNTRAAEALGIASIVFISVENLRTALTERGIL